MFEKIKSLVESLDQETVLKNYKNTVNARRALKDIKQEAQRLRLLIIEERKKK